MPPFLFDLDYVIIDKLMVSYHDLALAAIGIVLKVERFPPECGHRYLSGHDASGSLQLCAGSRKRMEDTIRSQDGWGLGLPRSALCCTRYLRCSFLTCLSRRADGWDGFPVLRIRVLATPLMFLSFFYGLPVPGLRKGWHCPVSGGDQVADF